MSPLGFVATITNNERSIAVNCFDHIQNQFLGHLGLTDTEAFVTYNFAPISVRRAIGMLRFLHKRVLGVLSIRGQRAPWHDKQLESYYNSVCSHARLYPRSIFHYILIYNRLPQWLVDKKSV